MYNTLKAYAELKDSWTCRIPSDNSNSSYIPLLIPMMGIVDHATVHINNHFNFAFHVDRTSIIGASIYPVRDALQYMQPGTKLSLHGPVRWFLRHTYTPLTSSSSSMSMNASDWTLVLGCFFTALITSLLFVLLYQTWPRPQLLASFRKLD